jgi:starch phosphorylase
MTAAMNASINLSVNDGWVAEFAKHRHNAFVIPHADPQLSEEQKDELEYQSLMHLLEQEVVAMYYDKPDQWLSISKNSMQEVVPYFESSRMASEYYNLMYNHPALLS